MGDAGCTVRRGVVAYCVRRVRVYVANFSSYDKTYGTMGGLVVFLVWMWLTNTALLLGMELNAERERSRELEAGIPGAERELQRDARSTPKRQKTT